jgi:hypothetical protein
MGTSLAMIDATYGHWAPTPTSACGRSSMRASGREWKALGLAERLEIHDPNAAVVAIFGACRYDAHRSPVVLEQLALLELMVEPGRGPFGREAVDVEDVVEGVCHKRLGQLWARKPRHMAMRMRGLEPPRGFPHTDLNRARLPIPPHPRGGEV